MRVLYNYRYKIFILGRKLEVLKILSIPNQNRNCRLKKKKFCVKEKEIQMFQRRTEELLNYLDKLKLFVSHIAQCGTW